jgi:hypothetical protein
MAACVAMVSLGSGNQVSGREKEGGGKTSQDSSSVTSEGMMMDWGFSKVIN